MINSILVLTALVALVATDSVSSNE